MALGTAPVAGAAAPDTPRIPAEYTLREWHEQDGLPSDELAGVLQDADGYLWIASNKGLARFDGMTFEPVEIPRGGHARSMVCARGGRPGAARAVVIAGCREGPSGEAGWYSLEGGAFAFHQEAMLTSRVPQSVFEGPDASLWLGCEDGTVLRRQGGRTMVYENPAGLTGKRIPAFATDADGVVWIARANHLARVDGGVLAEVPFGPPEPEIHIASSATGGIWVFTRTDLLRWNGTAFEQVLPLPRLLGAHYVQAALEDRHGQLWVGTRSQGLHRIIGREILPVPSSNDYVRALYEDVDGNIWAATDGGGLSRLRPRAHRLIDQASGLKDNFSYTVAGDARGAIWLANRDGGVARIAGGTIDPISRRAGWRDFNAISVYPSPDGHIWMATGIGVYRTGAASPETLERVTPLNDLCRVRSTFVASNGDYWLALDPDRVVRWRNGQLATFGPEEGFDGREVRAFAEDASGRIWVGAADGGLFRSNGGRFEPLPFPGAADCGSLQVIHFQDDGTLLIGTTRQGVIVFPQGDLSRPLPLNSDHGMLHNNVTQILADDHDRTWFASRGGIFWVHNRHLRDFTAGRAGHVHAIMLGEDDGLPGLSCNGLYQPAAWKAADGTLWFATHRGMLHSDPALTCPGGEAPPPVTIWSITCDGRPRPLAGVLKIPAGVRKTQIHLSALNLSAPGNVQVRFRLEGFDDAWVIQGRDRLVTYPRLPPGRYVFSTQASNGSGLWSSQPTLLTIIVEPPWWQTWWAELVFLGAVIGTVALAVRRWSHRRLRLRLERSEQARAIERERTRIARNIHDELGATLTRISLLTQSAQQETPAHSPTLERIYEATHAITRAMDEIVWAVNPSHDNTESLVYYLGNFAQSFLGAAGIRCRLETPAAASDTPLTTQVRHHLFLCCKEALNNVVRHACATEAMVRIAIDRDVLTVVISDNGRGIAASRQAPGDPQRVQPGNGLRNMEQRMSEIRGACTVSARPGGGTTVAFTVPITAGTR